MNASCGRRVTPKQSGNLAQGWHSDPGARFQRWTSKFNPAAGCKRLQEICGFAAGPGILRVRCLRSAADWLLLLISVRMEPLSILFPYEAPAMALTSEA